MEFYISTFVMPRFNISTLFYFKVSTSESI